MLIECTIPEADNLVTVANTRYHFRRETGRRDAPMLAEVGDSSHAAELLTLPNFKAFALPEEADDGDEGGDDAPPGDPLGPYAMKTMDELREIYQERFGRAAHPSAKFETLVARLQELDPKE